MNKIEQIEVFTARNPLTNQPETRIKISRENTGNRYYVIHSLVRGDRWTKVLRENCTSQIYIDPDGCMCVQFEPKPTGKVVEAQPVKPTYHILASRFIPATDNQQIVYVAVAGVCKDWAGYVGVLPQSMPTSKAIHKVAAEGIKLFEAEAQGMFTGWAIWEREYRR